MLGYVAVFLFGLWLVVTLAAMVVIIYLFSNLPAPERPAEGRRLQGEDVRFPTASGSLLAGTFLRAKGRLQAPCIIFSHPFGADRHSAAQAASFLTEAGFHLFAFDFRGHGESPNTDRYRPERWITPREQEDLLAAVSYCASRPEVEPKAIGLFGLSRGANASICAAGHHRAVRAVAAESAFCTRELLKWHIKKRAPIYVEIPWLWRHFPDPLFGFITDLSLGAMRWLMGRRYLRVSRAVGLLDGRPCLFIHGERDPYIDSSLARQLFELAREPKALWIVPGARHNEGLQVEPELYRERLVAFFRRHLEDRAC